MALELDFGLDLELQLELDLDPRQGATPGPRAAVSCGAAAWGLFAFASCHVLSETFSNMFAFLMLHQG